MRHLSRPAALVLLLAPIAFALLPRDADSACCYFSAKDKDVNQPAQKAFLTYDPVEKVLEAGIVGSLEYKIVEAGRQTTCTLGSRTTAIAIPATRPRSTSTCRRSGCSRS